MLSGGLWMGPPRPIGPVKRVLLCGGGDEEAPLWSSGWGPPFISPEYPKQRPDKDAEEYKLNKVYQKSSTDHDQMVKIVNITSVDKV